MKPVQFLILVVFIPLFLASNTTHDYYVSVTKIEYAKTEQTLQIISQIFINDFEKLLRQRYSDTLTLNTKEEPEAVEVYMQRYLSEKLNIKVNTKNVEFKFIGKEYKDDITYCYLEIENIANIQSIEVTNRILFDAFTEQQNIVRLKLKAKNKSFLLLPDADKCVLNFD